MTNQNLKAPHVIELSERERERAAALITPLESTFRSIAPQCSFNVAMNTYARGFQFTFFRLLRCLHTRFQQDPNDFSPVC